MIQDFTSELQSNGSRPNFQETGTSGLDAWSGYIYEAYNADLYWPDVYTLYNRLRRSDPEITIIRHLYSAMAHDVTFEWELPEDATPADEQLNEFLNSLLNDIQGGQRRFIDAIVSYVPFMGWGWWEAVPGVRQDGWRNDDEWESNYNDGLIGFRKLAWRDHSSFNRWIMDDATGVMSGMEQQDYPNAPVVIPLDRSIHLTFGDRDNPEGLTPLEAVWRLERIKYGLEVVQGIGYEHAAGHFKIKAFEELDASAKAIIRQAARAVLTAQEGNYFTEIDGKFEGDIMDVGFQAAPSILEAIRYYGILKLQVYNMQWVSIAATAGAGAYAAMQDSSTMMLSMWNAMMAGFAEQAGDQLWTQAKRYNPALFAGASQKHKLLATPIEKEIPLGEMAQLLPVLFQTIPLDEDDFIAIRRKLGFLPETLPEVDEVEEPVEEVEEIPEEEVMEEEAEMAELQEEPFPENSQPDAVITESDIERALRRFRSWASKNVPGMTRILDAEIAEPAESL